MDIETLLRDVRQHLEVAKQSIEMGWHDLIGYSLNAAESKLALAEEMLHVRISNSERQV